MSGDNVGAKKLTITLHVVASLDGIIAKKDNSVSWMDSAGDAYEKGISDASGEEGMEPIDCFVLGARTYEHALEIGWPYGDTATVVVTHRELRRIRTSVEFYSGDLKKLVEENLAPRFRNIWLAGGANLCQSFLRLGLVNEIRLVIIPVVLGDGLHLFENAGIETEWNLKNVVGYKNGMVELSYRSRANAPSNSQP